LKTSRRYTNGACFSILIILLIIIHKFKPQYKMKNAEKTPRNPIRTKADLNDLARKAADHQKRLRLYGQSVLMFTGFGLFFTALFCASQPAQNDIARDLELVALFGLLVGSFGFACFYNDNKNN
jgi:uncharacterized membrane protein